MSKRDLNNKYNVTNDKQNVPDVYIIVYTLIPIFFIILTCCIVSFYRKRLNTVDDTNNITVENINNIANDEYLPKYIESEEELPEYSSIEFIISN